MRAGWRPRVYQGDSVPKLDIARDMPWLDDSSQQARDIERFRWFSNGYIARDPLLSQPGDRYPLLDDSQRNGPAVEYRAAARSQQ